MLLLAASVTIANAQTTPPIADLRATVSGVNLIDLAWTPPAGVTAYRLQIFDPITPAEFLDILAIYEDAADNSPPGSYTQPALPAAGDRAYQIDGD